jgi:serine/threonine protein kinase
MSEQIEKMKIEPDDKGPEGDALRRQYRIKCNAFSDLVTQCLQLDPKTRITPDKILAHPFCQPLK